MCGVKTENLALNVSRAEADFWRAESLRHGKRSRGEFQKMLLEMGLAQLDHAAAKVLRQIREHYRQFGAATLLAMFCLTLLEHDPRVRQCSKGRCRDEIQCHGDLETIF